MLNKLSVEVMEWSVEVMERKALWRGGGQSFIPAGASSRQAIRQRYHGGRGKVGRLPACERAFAVLRQILIQIG